VLSRVGFWALVGLIVAMSVLLILNAFTRWVELR
jgi:hypothetical protein